MNNGIAILEQSYENGVNDTCASTKAIFGDDSTYATNLAEVNKDLKENDSFEHRGENGHQEHHHENDDLLTKSTIDMNAADNVSENGAFESEDYPSIVEKEKPADEANSILSSSNITYNRDSGKYEAEKEVPQFDELLENHIDAPSSTRNDVFDCLSFTNDSTSDVIQKMTNFDYGTTAQSSLLDNDSPFGANSVTSPTLEIYNGDVSNTNPFAVDSSDGNEKENAEEKEVDDDADVQLAKQPVQTAFEQKKNAFEFDPFGDKDHVDFTQTSGDPFQSVFADASAPQLSALEKEFAEEKITAKTVHDVEVNPETGLESHVESTNDLVAPTQEDISAQILDLDEYEVHKSGSELEDDNDDVNVVPANNAGSAEQPVSSIDMETPYIHECSRVSEKPDSVHEPVSRKHFDDLLPDDTMESDKLESELRESDKGVDFTLGFGGNFTCNRFEPTAQENTSEYQSMYCNLIKPSVPKPQHEATIDEEPKLIPNDSAEAEPVQKNDIVPNTDISVPEVSSNEPELTNEAIDDNVNISTPPSSAVSQNQAENAVSIAEAVDKISQEQKSNASAITAAAAAVGVATAVAAGVAIAQDKKEAPVKKSSVIRKPEGTEKPKAPSKTTTKAPLGAAKPRTSTTSTLKSTSTAAKKPTTAAPTKTTPVKSTLTARPTATKSTTPTTRTSLTAKPSSATKPTAKTLTKPASPLKARPTTASSLTARPTSTKPLTNGDVTSTTKTAPRKPSLTSIVKKTISSPTTSAPPKPTVNLATRTSLAPKPKPLSKTDTAADKPKTTIPPKRPISAPSKITNKDSKDITNKRLSTSKPATTTAKTSTLTKTESKVNTGLKSSSSKSTAIKRPSDSNANQSVTATTKTLNGNA